ncbi:PepSY-associated TM helix domain-containing protein [Algivirga pacifica]|uniref:PepSY-associated TM helix domain-containing protein n=1 Tax=Algivirga pacifica TaxID=1162670 RepID=A0ABP9CZ75_9BACT
MPTLLRKRKKDESLFKYIIALTHLWLGLLSGVVLFVVCLTGSILVFEQPITDAFNAKVATVVPQQERVSLDSIQANYYKAHTLPLGRVTVPTEEDQAVHLYASNRKSGERISVYANPYTGELIGEDNAAVHTFFSTTMQLHRWLLVRGVGKTIVGISTVIFLFMLLGGIVLWWPKRIKQIKQVLTVKWDAKFYRLNYDLHNVLGFYAAFGLFFIAFTGLYFSFPAVRNGIKTTLGAEITQKQAQQHNHNHGPEGGKKGNRGGNGNRNRKAPQKTYALQQGYELLQAQLPYNSEVRMSFPGRRNKNLRFQKYNTANAMGAYLPEYIEVNRQGKLLLTQRYEDLPLDRKVTSIIRPLHTGEIMGWPSMILYFILCAIGTSLPVTGFLIWWKRKGGTSKASKNTQKTMASKKREMIAS